MEKNHLKSIIVEQHEQMQRRETGYLREALSAIAPKLKLKHNLIITGPRRAGKSTLLLQLMRRHLAADAFYFLRFDDERLLNFTVEDFNLLYECFIELQGERAIFFFDEIQNIPDWERFVNRMYEQGKQFILTGFNANLLSTELSSLLTGRHLDFELYPFSFTEFLQTKQFTLSSQNFFNTRKRAKVNTLFSEYLTCGGFPEYLLQGDPQILQELFRDIITKDIVLRHNVREAHAIRELAGYLVSNVTSLISYNSLCKHYDLGSPHTIKNFIASFEEVYLFFELPMFSFSVRRQAQNKRKIYAIDNAVVKANGFAFSENLGKQLENLVFLELKRQGGEIFYHKGNHECDFLVKEGNDLTQAIQVTALLNDANREREFQGLFEAMDAYTLKKGLLLTLDQRETITHRQGTVEILPVSQWIVEGSDL